MSHSQTVNDTSPYTAFPQSLKRDSCSISTPNKIYSTCYFIFFINRFETLTLISVNQYVTQLPADRTRALFIKIIRCSLIIKLLLRTHFPAKGLYLIL